MATFFFKLNIKLCFREKRLYGNNNRTCCATEYGFAVKKER